MAQEHTGTNTTTTIREDINTSLELTSMLLNSKNYQSLAKAARISLKGKDKLGFIDGTKPRPKTTSREEEWKVQDSVTMSLSQIISQRKEITQHTNL
jgi:gag-polypeptide of LTR copia-type